LAEDPDVFNGIRDRIAESNPFLSFFGRRANQGVLMEWRRGEYSITDDEDQVDLDVVMDLLSKSYWAAGRPRAKMARAINNSVCFSLYFQAHQIGFVRAVTDKATFAWICDVVIHPDHRGAGLGKWMMKCALEHPHIRDMQQVLRTRDAHGLYEGFGFNRGEFMWRSWQE
jgi:GNAT superfamily N-acetyltransferase